MTVPVCPICGCLLDFDTVDIGVGVQTGNYQCACCGWTPDADDYDITADVTGKFEGEL